MGLINLDHMKALALRTKAYMSGHLATLAQETVNSLEQMDAVKANKPLAVSVTIPTTGWQTDGTECATYPQYYDIPVEGVTPKDIPRLCIARTSEAAANDCGMSRTCETVAGAIRIWAGSVPTAEIQAEYVIEEGRDENTTAESGGE